MSSRTIRLARGAALGAVVTATACTGSAALDRGEYDGMRLAVANDRESTSHYGDYLAGNYARDIGEMAAAASYYERALAGSPGNLQLIEELMLVTTAAGDFDQALGYARDLNQARPEAEEARLLLVASEAKGNDPSAAREGLERIPDRGIAGLAKPFLDAWLIVQADGPGAVDDAIRRLDDAESLGALNDYHRAMIYYAGGREDEALEVFDGAVGTAGPVPYRMAQAYAVILADAGKREQAIEFLTGQLSNAGEQPHLESTLAVLQDGGDPPPPFEDPVGAMADALLGLAEALYQEGSGERAIFYVRTAQYLDPAREDAALLVGDIMSQQDNQEAAIEAYEQIAEASPLHYQARLRIARSLYDLERHEDAVATLEELGAQDPERLDALIQLGDMLRRDEEYGRAEQAYSQAIERIDQPTSNDWSLFYTRGITRERTDQWPEAEADFLKALELQPEQPFVLNYLGYSWVDMGMHFDRAKEMLVRAVELRPNDGFIVDSLGWVHYRLGEYDQAVERLERAVELEPGDPVINDHLGDAYWRVGRTREARYQWERALTLEPEDDVVETIRDKLENGLPERDDVRIDRI